jgi:hypothetical protein
MRSSEGGLKVVFDASPLITACKFQAAGRPVIDHLIEGCQIVIPPRVEEEVAILGAAYPDGVLAGHRIAGGSIQVVTLGEPRWSERLAAYAIGAGERDAVELYTMLGDAEALVSDDYLAFIAATRLGVRTWMLPDLVTQIVQRNYLPRDTARVILLAIRNRYRTGVIEHSLADVEETST